MKKNIPFFLLSTVAFLTAAGVKGQYYYKDIVSHAQNQAKFSRFKKWKVSSVSVTSYEAAGEPSEGFRFNQQINNGYTQAKTVMEMPFSGRMSLTNFYNAQGQLYRTTDSGYQTYTVYEYGYDSLQRLTTIIQQAQAIGDKTRTTETHRWTYDLNGVLQKMVRIKGTTDSSTIQLVTDAEGKVLEEFTVADGKPGEKTYYYYDEKGRLTDIVRYNERAGKLLPDMMFDYYDNGLPRQMVSREPGSFVQSTWIYLYDEKELVTEEKFYNAQKKLAGRMAYQYQFRK
jgi:YD repeat-containing protein